MKTFNLEIDLDTLESQDYIQEDISKMLSKVSENILTEDPVKETLFRNKEGKYSGKYFLSDTNKESLAYHIASANQARKNCYESGNHVWYDRWEDILDNIERNFLPSGSGIDSGTKIDRDRSTANKIVLTTEFHHMNDAGFYDGWTEHTITVTPTFESINLKIGGRNRNQIKDYLYDVFYWNLVQTYTSEDLTPPHYKKDAA